MTVGTGLKYSKVKIIEIASTRTGLNAIVNPARMTNIATVMGWFFK
jgi:hypothetical protein